MPFLKITYTKWLPCFIMVMCLQISGTNSTPTVNGLTQNEVPRRSIRSPQLFNIPKNPLTDLTQQLKPPTINDLNEFRQKIANFANFTGLLEKALEAEKAARNSLQGFVTKLKDQVTGITTAVNPDPENYWLESKECGGVLVSQTGRISYKLKDHYNDNERCLWTIRANYRSKITIAFTTGGLEDLHDYVAVTELVDKNGAYGAEWTTKRLKPGQTSIFEGPLLFISFVSDGTIRENGFQLDFTGMGSNINTRIMYHHVHYTNWAGQILASNLSEKVEEGQSLDGYDNMISTMVFNPSSWNASKLMVSIPESMINLRPVDCNTTSLSVLNDFSVKSHGTSEMCCGKTCAKNEYETSNGIMLAVFSSSNLNEKSEFHINWSTGASGPYVLSENTCGGILTGDSGKISYKMDAQYGNNEKCIWVIHRGELQKSQIKVQLLSEGFEVKYDYVTISYFKDDDQNTPMESQFLYQSGGPVAIPASIAFIKFYSDSFTVGGKGFEMIWEFKDTLGELPGFQVDYTTDKTGFKALSCSQQAIKSNSFTVINPQFAEVVPLVLSSDSANLEVFTSRKGNFSKSLETTKHTSEDGTAIVSHKCQDGESEESIKWEKGTLSSTNSDNLTFVTSEDRCGDVLHGDSGRISYKRGQAYEDRARCTWIIRAKHLSKISIQLMTDGFESCCDKVLINRINTVDGSIDASQVIIDREHLIQTLEGPILLVTFFSDHSVHGTGFELEFQTKGEEISDADANLKVSHSYYLIDSQTTPDRIIIQPQEPSIVMNTLHFNDSDGSINTMFHMNGVLTRECTKEPILLHKMEGQEYQLNRKYPNESMCGNSTGSTTEETVSFNDEFKSIEHGSIFLSGRTETGYGNKSISISFS